MIEYFLSGVILRASQIIVDASIWIAFGCFISAILRNMVGPEKTRQLFGENSRFSLLIGWAIGMLIPVCSLGVIPVLAELYRSRVKPGTIVAFGLTAPLFNPISVLYGLSLSDPFAIIIFAAAAVLIVTAMGAIWGRTVNWNDFSAKDEAVDLVPATGIKRSLAVVHSASTSLASWPLVYLLIGILTSAMVSAYFPSGSLQTSTEPDDVWAPAFMATFVAPVYSTPLLAMSQIGGMFQHGNSVGAAFSLLILGTGVNLGVMVWFGVAFGFRRFMIFVGLLFAITLALAYGLDKPLYPKGVDTAGHTHAFDIYTHPYHEAEGLLNKSFEDAQTYRLKNGLIGTNFLFVLGCLGIVFQILQLKYDVRGWLDLPAPEKTGPKWDIALPAWVIGTVACVCLIIASVFGTFIYYPKADTLLNDLSAINTYVVSSAKSGDFEIVKENVPYCEDLSRRLEVGVFLRKGTVSDFKRVKAKNYREKLDELRDYIEDGKTEKVDRLAMDVYKSYLQLSETFRGE